ESEMRSRRRESYDPVIISREASRHVSRENASRENDRYDEPDPMAQTEPAFVPEPAFEPHSAPVSFQELTPGNASHAEVVSLDAMRSVAPSYQAEDLDVPAFLRKRNEVM